MLRARSRLMQQARGRRRLVGLIVVVAIMLVAGFSMSAAAQPHVRVLDVDGTITPVMADYVERGIREAESAGDAAIVLRMDTPGGLSAAMDDIVRAILGSDVPVVVYISPSGARAGSAGVYITYAAHIAAMAPSTNIGSATPVFLNESGQPAEGDDAMTQKVVNDAVAQIRGLAELRGRNADWAERAVREAANVTASEALDLSVVDMVAPDLPTLLNTIDGRTVSVASGTVTLQTSGAEITQDSMSLARQFLQIISDPTVAYLLLSLGGVGLFFELANPGSIFPGVAGAIALLLGLFSLGSLDASWAALLLIGLAFVLFLLEVYVASSGILAAGGVVAFALGSFLLADSIATPVLAISRVTIITVTLLLSALLVLIVWSAVRAQRRPVTTGSEGLIGMVGTAREPLNPDGLVFVNGELWTATSPAGRLSAGTRVVVSRVDGMRLVVVPESSTEAPEPAPKADVVTRPVASGTGRGLGAGLAALRRFRKGRAE